MSKQFKNFLIRVLFLSTFIVIVFNIWDNMINAKNKNIDNTNKDSITIKENNSNFKKINSSTLWKTWVAISTNIWIRYKQKKDIPVTIYKDIFSINEIISDQKIANNEIIWSNMLVIEEYRNILKTNIKQLIDTNLDKPRILNAFIEQLEFRYVLSIENSKNLVEQKTIFETAMNNADSKIEILKQKIENDFRSNKSTESLENINTYLDLKKEYYYARTYIVYINHFLSEYNYLNNYTKVLLDTLINNKEAIIKNSFVVLPDSWTQLLRKFNLIYDEEEYKKEIRK